MAASPPTANGGSRSVAGLYTTARRRLTRAFFPRVMEYKMISREREKHEFMPVVYVIDRSESFLARVPTFVEHAIVQAYITPLVLGGAQGESAKHEQLAHALRERTMLMDVATAGVCTDEARYKLGVLVDYSTAASAREKSDLYQVVRTLASTLREAKATHQRALVVPVTMHFCSSEGVVNVNRFVGIRYGAPVLLEARDIATFAQDPVEFVQHISARLSASLKMQPPSTATQMEILRLSRTLHVYCAQVFRDDCFSRRQIASMNEEILQIHFRTRNHPDMHVLKAKMTTYFRILRHWRLRDEDINSAAIENHPLLSQSPVHLAWVAVIVLERVLTAPAHLFLSGTCDLMYRPPQQRKQSALALTLAALVKCALALVALGVLFRLAQSQVVFWGLTGLALLLSLVHVAKDSLGYREVAQHLKKVQFHLMDASELRELKETRAVLARRIHTLLAHYLSTDLPQPVLQDRSKASADDSVLLANDEYTLNPHHKIFINAPRSYPLAYTRTIRDPALVRQVVYAPKMLRDETWRTIYETLAPKHLQFSALLVNNKGDNLPMRELLQTPLFNAVLTAYVTFQTQPTASDDERAQSAAPGCYTGSQVADVATAGASAFGDFGSAEAVIDAAIQLAQEEAELSS